MSTIETLLGTPNGDMVEYDPTDERPDVEFALGDAWVVAWDAGVAHTSTGRRRSPIYPSVASVVTVHHELVHEAKSAGEADLVAMRLIGSQPGIREDQIAQVISRPLSVVEQLQRQNLTAWQESEAVKHSDRMYPRWAHHLLPEEELREHVRRALFAPLNEFRRRRRMTALAVPHPRTPFGGVQCVLGGDPARTALDLESLMLWATVEVPEMKRDDYATLDRLEEAARLIADHPWLSMSPADCVSTHLREHVGTCSVCKRTVSQRSVLVTVQWAGRTLSREYAL